MVSAFLQIVVEPLDLASVQDDLCLAVCSNVGFYMFAFLRNTFTLTLRVLQNVSNNKRDVH